MNASPTRLYDYVRIEFARPEDLDRHPLQMDLEVRSTEPSR
jgi:hypothetical protein